MATVHAPELLIVMSGTATPEEVEHVVARLEARPLRHDPASMARHPEPLLALAHRLQPGGQLVELDVPVPGVERRVPRDVGVGHQGDLASAPPGQLGVGRLEKRTPDPATPVRRVDRDLLEVPVPVEVEHGVNPMTVPSSSTATNRMPGSAARSSPVDAAGHSTPPNRSAKRVSPASSMPARNGRSSGRARRVVVIRSSIPRPPDAGLAERGRFEDHHRRGHRRGALARKVGAMSHTYGISEVVGTSTTSIDEAISSAVARASTTVRGLDWFEVTEIRGHLEEGVSRTTRWG